MFWFELECAALEQECMFLVNAAAHFLTYSSHPAELSQKD